MSVVVHWTEPIGIIIQELVFKAMCSHLYTEEVARRVERARGVECEKGNEKKKEKKKKVR